MYISASEEMISKMVCVWIVYFPQTMLPLPLSTNTLLLWLTTLEQPRLIQTELGPIDQNMAFFSVSHPTQSALQSSQGALQNHKMLT